MVAGAILVFLAFAENAAGMIDEAQMEAEVALAVAILFASLIFDLMRRVDALEQKVKEKLG